MRGSFVKKYPFGRRKINRARAIRCFSPLERILPSDRGHEYAQPISPDQPDEYFAQRFIVYGQGKCFTNNLFSKPVLINGVCDTYQLSAGEKYHL